MIQSRCKLLFLNILALVSFFSLSTSRPIHGAEPAKSAVKYPYPGKVKPDLWLFAGQSNMAGYGTMKEVTKPDPRILFFASDRKWVVAKDPLERLFYPHGNPHGMVPDYTKLPVGGTGPALFFAQHLLKHMDRPIGIIGVATGRSMEKVWNPDLMKKGNNFIYGDMVKWVNEAGGYGSLKGMVWYQGESDAVEFPADAKLYERNLLKLVDHIRKDTGNPNLPFIHVQIGRMVPNVVPGIAGKAQGGEELADAFATYSHAWETVREVQRQLADKRDHVYLVSAVDLYPLADPIHLDFEAYQRLGPRLAEVALFQVYKLRGHATPIKLESAHYAATLDHHTHKPIQGVCTIRVRFSGVTGKLQAKGAPSGFELRFPELTPAKARNTVPVVYRIDFDPDDRAVVLLRSTGTIALVDGMNPVLYYGGGLNPYCNIADDKDIPIPAFGPVKMRKDKAKPAKTDDEKPAVSQSQADRAARMIPTKIEGNYRGGKLIKLRVHDRMAYVVKPTGAVDPQKRWLWEFPFWLGINDGLGSLQHRKYVEKLLAAGFHIAGVDVGPSCASPSAAKVCQEFYERIVADYGLHKRARIMGQSHGGLIAYGWAFRNPTCVDRIAGICPATDFRTWPTLANVIPFSKQGLGYDLTLQELTRRTAEFNPIDNLAPLAKAGVKILHIHGDKDDLVPMAANSTKLASRYRQLGGSAQIVVLKGLGHGGQVLYDSKPLLNFLLAK